MTLRPLLAQARMEVVLTLRRGETLLATLGIPVGVLAFFAATDVVDTGFDDDLDFLVPGVLALAVVATAMVSLGIATAFERRYGVLKRLGTTPLGRGRLVGAKCAAVVAVQLVQVAVLTGLGLALGWRPAGGVEAALAAAGLLLLGTVAFAGLGLLMAGTLRAEGTLGLANALYVAFILLGGVAVPLERLPRALEAMARATPAAQLAEGVRAVLVPGQGLELWMVLGLAAWATAAPLAAGLTFRWEE